MVGESSRPGCHRDPCRGGGRDQVQRREGEVPGRAVPQRGGGRLWLIWDQGGVRQARENETRYIIILSLLILHLTTVYFMLFDESKLMVCEFDYCVANEYINTKCPLLPHLLICRQ